MPQAVYPTLDATHHACRRIGRHIGKINLRWSCCQLMVPHHLCDWGASFLVLDASPCHWLAGSLPVSCTLVSGPVAVVLAACLDFHHYQDSLVSPLVVVIAAAFVIVVVGQAACLGWMMNGHSPLVGLIVAFFVTFLTTWGSCWCRIYSYCGGSEGGICYCCCCDSMSTQKWSIPSPPWDI